MRRSRQLAYHILVSLALVKGVCFGFESFDCARVMAMMADHAARLEAPYDKVLNDFEILTIGDLNGDKVPRVLAEAKKVLAHEGVKFRRGRWDISILPVEEGDTSAHPLNRFAGELKRKHGILVKFNPGALHRTNSTGMYFYNGKGTPTIFISTLAITQGVTPIEIHEYLHGFFEYAEKHGLVSIFSGYVESPSGARAAYPSYMSLEELATHAFELSLYGSLYRSISNNPRTLRQLYGPVSAVLDSLASVNFKTRKSIDAVQRGFHNGTVRFRYRPTNANDANEATQQISYLCEAQLKTGTSVNLLLQGKAFEEVREAEHERLIRAAFRSRLQSLMELSNKLDGERTTAQQAHQKLNTVAGQTPENILKVVETLEAFGQIRDHFPRFSEAE